TLRNRARSMRLQANVPVKLWDHFIETAAYLTVRTPTRTLVNSTPFEAYYGHKPDVSHLREIGCASFVLIQN
ncbi:hypothetical protein OE88DRAFT_1599236, partial [Heliocybe sulcata]